MIKRIFLFILFFSLTGCFSTTPRKYYYELYYKPYPKGYETRNFILRVEPVTADKIYKRYNIVYRKNPYLLFYYSNRFWASRPEDMIRDLLYKEMVASSIFEKVEMELEQKPHYTVSARIFFLDELKSKDKTFARLAMELTLKEFDKGKVIVDYSFDDKKEVYLKDTVYVVRALSELLKKHLDIFVGKVNEAL